MSARSIAAIRLNALRAERTGVVLAGELGTNERTLGAWCHGRRRPCMVARTRIDEVLGIPAEDWGNDDAQPRKARKAAWKYGPGPAMPEFRGLVARVESVLENARGRETKRFALWLRPWILDLARECKQRVEHLEEMEVGR